MAAQIDSVEAQRIMGHMNKASPPRGPRPATRLTRDARQDHGKLLAHFIEYYGRIAGPANVSMASFASDKMVLKYTKGPGGQRFYTHLFQPSIGAGEARTRLLALHSRARKGLGFVSFISLRHCSPLMFDQSAVTINRRLFGLNSLGAIVAGMTALQISLLLASPQQTTKYLPWAARWATSLLEQLGYAASAENVNVGVKLLLVAPVQLAHLIECVTVLRPLLRRYNTSAGVRAQYYIACLFAGFPVRPSARGGRADDMLRCGRRSSPLRARRSLLSRAAKRSRVAIRVERSTPRGNQIWKLRIGCWL